MTQPTRTTMGATASGRRLSKHFLTAAVAASSASLLAAHSASADIIYSGVINFACAVDIDGCYINVQTGALSNGPGTGVPGWDLNPYMTTGGMNFFNSTGGGQMRFPGVTTGAAGNLPAVTSVVSTGSFNTATTAVTFGSVAGNWQYSADNIIGFKFVAAAGTTHYGWMRFAMGAIGSAGLTGTSANAATRTVVDYAYESLANTPIPAGSQGGPPPVYDPCAAFNPTASTGSNNLPLNQTTSTDLVVAGGCGFTAYHANYFKFVAPFSGAFTIDTCASGADTRMAVLDGCAAGSAVMTCDDDSCGVSSRMVLNATGAQTYYIVVGASSVSAVLPSPITVAVTPPPSPACIDAPALAFGTSSFSNATSTIGNQTVTTSATGTTIVYNAEWYTFTPAVTGVYSFSTCGSANDTKMALSASPCPATGATLTSIAYNDDNCACSSGCSGNFSSALNLTNTGLPLTQELIAGQAYKLVIGGFSSTSGSVSGSLVIDGPAQPPASCLGDLNDDGAVTGADLGLLLGAWGTCPGGTPGCIGDLNVDGVVNGADLGLLLGAWGPCP